MKKVTVFLLAAVLALGLLAGCGGDSTPANSDILTIMGSIKTENLDSLVGTPRDPNLMSSVFGALIRRGENGLEPGIIEKWDLSADGLTTTFTRKLEKGSTPVIPSSTPARVRVKAGSLRKRARAD